MEGGDFACFVLLSFMQVNNTSTIPHRAIVNFLGSRRMNLVVLLGDCFFKQLYAFDDFYHAILSPLLKRFSRWVLRLAGWQIQGQMPLATPKSVIIAAPHTSNWTYPIP
jgi:hypothetical protein